MVRIDFSAFDDCDDFSEDNACLRLANVVQYATVGYWISSTAPVFKEGMQCLEFPHQRRRRLRRSNSRRTKSPCGPLTNGANAAGRMARTGRIGSKPKPKSGLR